VRYALAPNTAGLIAEIDRLEDIALVQQLDAPPDPADLGAAYDIVAAYGEVPGWQLSAITPRVTLVIRPDALPGDTAALVTEAIDPAALVDRIGVPGASTLTAGSVTPGEVRAAFANLGHPDGFGLVLGSAYVPGTDQVQDALTALNVPTRAIVMDNAAIRAALDAGEIDAALVTWTTEDEAQAWRDFAARDLYTLPIRYQAVQGLTITFTPGGWPIATREG
jgi:hypothetical protein